MNVHILPLGALETNCYILESDKEALIFDPADKGELILKKLDALHLKAVAVLLTHCHFDHMMGVDDLCRHGNIPLYCPLKDVNGRTDSVYNVSSLFGMPPFYLQTKPERLLKEGDVISVGSEQVEVLETPGHTVGSVCYKAGNLLFSGDTLFYHGYGRTDLPGGNAVELKSSLSRILSLKENLTVYPGHGPITKLDNERRFFGMN